MRGNLHPSNIKKNGVDPSSEMLNEGQVEQSETELPVGLTQIYKGQKAYGPNKSWAIMNWRNFRWREALVNPAEFKVESSLVKIDELWNNWHTHTSHELKLGRRDMLCWRCLYSCIYLPVISNDNFAKPARLERACIPELSWRSTKKIALNESRLNEA